jgi:hypothetical protein
MRLQKVSFFSSVKNPGHRKMLRDFFYVALLLPAVSTLARAQTAAADPMFAFVIGSWIRTPVGTYIKSEKRWVSGYDFYAPFQPEAVVSLFDLGGKAGEVRVLSERRPDPSGVPKGWMAPIEKWTPSPGSEPYAMALKGSWPAPTHFPQAIPLDDSKALEIMRAALSAHRLEVPDPRMTQALRLNLTPDGTDYLLFLSAWSDPKTFQDGIAGARYTMSLLYRHARGRDKTFTLESQTSFKPAHRTVEEHEHFYGTADQDRFVTFVDLNGDGKNEMVLYVAHQHALTVDVFTFDGKTPRKVISVDKLTDL